MYISATCARRVPVKQNGSPHCTELPGGFELTQCDALRLARPLCLLQARADTYRRFNGALWRCLCATTAQSDGVLIDEVSMMLSSHAERAAN